MGVLSREQIKDLNLIQNPGNDTFQPNGADLRVSEVYRFISPLEVTEQAVYLPETAYIPFEEIKFTNGNYVEYVWDLSPGSYLITFAERVNLPKGVMAYFHPRSSLLRGGVSVQGAVWDAGYEGRGQALLVVHNPYGFVLQRLARVGQLTFHFLDEEPEEGYNGQYQEAEDEDAIKTVFFDELSDDVVEPIEEESQVVTSNAPSAVGTQWPEVREKTGNQILSDAATTFNEALQNLLKESHQNLVDARAQLEKAEQQHEAVIRLATGQ